MRHIGRRAAVAVAVLAIGLGAGACTDTLVEPRSTVTGANVFSDPDAYTAFLAKLYAGLAVTGQQGPSGNNDIAGIDEGFGQYLRMYWYLQDITTEEAVIGWGDTGLPDLVTMQWGSSNQFVNAMYYRAYYQIALANEFLRETTDEKLAERGQSDLEDLIHGYRAEARWLRALSYWHALDLFGNVPLVDENFVIGATPPEQATRAEVFAFVESELNDIIPQLPAGAGGEVYGRATQGAAQMLRAKLYLNAEVYGVGARHTETMADASAVIAGPYDLASDYQLNFLADNHTSPELIFAIPFDGIRTQTWGGTTFLVAGAIVNAMDPQDFGTSQEWGGLRLTQQAVAFYEEGADGPDERSDIIFTQGQDSIVDDYTDSGDGYGFPKYSNLSSTGVSGSHPTHMDTDYPMFRLADAYLMYAEACLRSGGGACAANSLTYVNAIRERAYGDTSGNITAGELTLDFILAERGRELIWEAHRRQDLIRYGLFTGGEYLWAFKGGVADGQTVAETRDLFPIPANELLANPNMEQNPGY